MRANEIGSAFSGMAIKSTIGRPGLTGSCTLGTDRLLRPRGVGGGAVFFEGGG